MNDVMAVAAYESNADLIVACHRLGYLKDEWLTLDATYGYGTFWNKWRPSNLVCQDLDAEKAPDGVVDFMNLPYADNTFNVVVFDPPYKLSGTPALGAFDERYGIQNSIRWQDRMQLIVGGAIECARVARNVMIVKVQDQVCSGKVRWQTMEVAAAMPDEFRLLDMLHLLSTPRKQPDGRRQMHSRRNYSTMMVFIND